MILALVVLPWLATALLPPQELAAEGWRPRARFIAGYPQALERLKGQARRAPGF